MEYQRVIGETILSESDIISPPAQNILDTKQIFIPSPNISNTEKEKYCQSLDQKQCYESTDCVAVLGPSCPMCMNVGYQGCKFSDLKVNLREKCNSTNGTWDTTYDSEDRFRPWLCTCPVDNSFSSSAGCTRI